MIIIQRMPLSLRNKFTFFFFFHTIQVLLGDFFLRNAEILLLEIMLEVFDASIWIPRFLFPNLIGKSL